MPYKMIATDLDRTLLRSDASVSEYTASVLHACKQRGVIVAFATARSENSCRRFTEIIHPDAIVSNGGALVRVGEKIVYRSAMSVEITNRLINFCLNQPNVGFITVETDKGYFVNRPIDLHDPAWVEYAPAHHVDFSQGLDCDSYKITVEIFDESAAREIASGFPSIGVTPFSGEAWYRFAEADKWHGVEALAAHLGIDIQNVAAFGDDYSDVEMIRNCGAGVAVANAIVEVKAVANVICETNDDDGVAKWLEAHVLLSK